MTETAQIPSKKDPVQRAESASHAPRSRSHERPDSPASRMFALQQTTGNHAVQRMLKTGAIQASLRIGQPNDIYEKEADRVADEVMRMPEPAVQRECSPGSKCPHKDDDEKKNIVLRKPGGTPQGITSVPDSFVRSLGSGQPLDPATRAFFEPRFGADFRDVRVHTGSMAAESAGGISARAYTYGTNIVFGKNQYAPGSPEGRQLLAHELTHVIQQGRAGSGLQDYTAARPVIQKLSTGPLLQRAGCPCCAESVSITNLGTYKSPYLMGNNLDVDITLKYPKKETSGMCTLRWLEKTDVPYNLTKDIKMKKDTWTDLYKISPKTFPGWQSESEEFINDDENEEKVICGSTRTVSIFDPPGFAFDEESDERTLEFRIIVDSSPDPNRSCAATKEANATQKLKKKKNDKGEYEPDWDNCSFTIQ